MAIEVPLMDLAFKANADLSTLQFYLVKLDTTAALQIGTCSATTDNPVGVLQNKPGSLQAATVRVQGVSKAVCGGALGNGSLVTTNASSQAAGVGTGVTTSYTLGFALDTVTTAGEVVSIFLKHAGRGA